MMNNKVKVGIIGHTGRLGKPLHEMLLQHPYAEIVYAESRKEGKNGNLSDAECVFLALPQDEGAEHMSYLQGKKVIDLSKDHRFSEGWVYGLPELNKAEIVFADKIANPGCYATSVILGLAPLIGEISDVCVSSTSGISGAGLSVVEEDNFLVYKEGKAHPQVSELTSALQLDDMLFVPQRIDTADKGIVSVMFAKYHGEGDFAEKYRSFYQDCSFVKVVDTISTRDVIATNNCHIKPALYGDRLMVVSCIDNTMKGGAGQAVQNFNLMSGLKEDIGL